MATRRRKARPTVEWELLDQPLYDRLIEALVFREHPTAVVKPMDGRGGDGGLDILVIETDGSRIIYQLKYFPEGFDGKHKKRRDQIKNSLARALSTEPHLSQWVLVAPCVPSPSGWVFIEDLKKENEDLTIDFVGRTRLDGEWLPRHNNLVRNFLERDELLEQARVLNAEQALLAGGVTDLMERHQNLDDVAALADPDWRWDITVRNEKKIAVLTPRHPQAENTSPISINFELDTASTHESVSAFQRAIDFGALDQVRIPGEAIRNFSVEGPELVRSASSEQIEALVIRPMREGRSPQPLALDLRGPDGGSLGIFQGTLLDIAPGQKGSSIRQEFQGGCVEFAWQMAFSAKDSSSVTVKVDLDRVGASIAQIRTTCDLLLALSHCARVDLLNGDGATLAVATGMHSGQAWTEEDLRVIREVADDLLFIENELGRQFRWPNQISDRDRIDLRVTRRLLEGKLVRLPDQHTLTATLRSITDVQEFSARLRKEPHQVLAEFDQVPWRILILEDQGPLAEFTFEKYALLLTEAQIEGAEAANEQLQDQEEPQVKIRPVAGARTAVYDPTRGGGHTQPAPWGLIGLESHDRGLG